MKDPLYILYADDDADDILLMKKTVGELNHAREVVGVSNGYELIKYLQSIKQGKAYPALIVLDIHMPRLNGKETLDLLKTDDMYRLIPVVMFSGDRNINDEDLFKRLGTKIVAKPKDYSDWTNTVKQLCTYCEE